MSRALRLFHLDLEILAVVILCVAGDNSRRLPTLRPAHREKSAGEILISSTNDDDAAVTKLRRYLENHLDFRRSTGQGEPTGK